MMLSNRPRKWCLQKYTHYSPRLIITQGHDKGKPILKASFKWHFEKKRHDPVWEEYDEAMDRIDERAVVRCKYCNFDARHPSAAEGDSSPTGMKRHLGKCLGYKRIQREREGTASANLPTLWESIPSLSSELEDRKPTVDRLKLEVLRFFIEGNIPFQQADNPHFQRILTWLIPSVKISRKSLRKYLSDEAKKAIADLKTVLNDVDSKISLALDCWTTRTGYAFMGNTTKV